MKLTYRIDPQGRIMIPMHIKKHLNLTPGSQVVIDVDGRSVRIRNAQEVCFICGKSIKKPSDMIAMSGKNEMSICSACAKQVEQESKKRGT